LKIDRDGGDSVYGQFQKNFYEIGNWTSFIFNADLAGNGRRILLEPSPTSCATLPRERVHTLHEHHADLGFLYTGRFIFASRQPTLWLNIYGGGACIEISYQIEALHHARR
jgi:hypothetical protein